MYITLTGVIIVIDIVVSCIAALMGKYDAASYYVLLGILYTLLFTGTEERYIPDNHNQERNDDIDD